MNKWKHGHHNIDDESTKREQEHEKADESAIRGNFDSAKCKKNLTWVEKYSSVQDWYAGRNVHRMKDMFQITTCSRR